MLLPPCSVINASRLCLHQNGLLEVPVMSRNIPSKHTSQTNKKLSSQTLKHASFFPVSYHKAQTPLQANEREFVPFKTQLQSGSELKACKLARSPLSRAEQSILPKKDRTHLAGQPRVSPVTFFPSGDPFKRRIPQCPFPLRSLACSLARSPSHLYPQPGGRSFARASRSPTRPRQSRASIPSACLPELRLQ